MEKNEKHENAPENQLENNEERREFKGLSPKQLRFCEEYMIDLNATEAAKRAGYSERSAYSIAGEQMKKPEIKEKLAELIEKRALRTMVTVDRIVEELACLSFYDPKVIALARVNCPDDIPNLPENVRRVIQGWSWDKAGNFVLKLTEKKGPLELLGRHLSMFTDNIASKVDAKVSAEITITPDLIKSVNDAIEQSC